MGLLLYSVAATFILAGFLKRTVPADRKDELASNGQVLFIVLLELIVWASWRVIIWPKFVSPLRALPGPSLAKHFLKYVNTTKTLNQGGSFFMGHYKRIIQEPTGAPMRDWMSTIPNQGLIRYTSAFNSERLLLTSPKALAEVMTHKSYEFIKPRMLIEGLKTVLGNGILFAEGEEHKRQRKNLNPAFSFRVVKNLYPTFWSVAKTMVKAIDSTLQPGGQDTVVEVGDWASRATLDIIGVAGFNTTFHALDNPDHLLYRTYRSVFQPPRMRRLVGLLGLLLPFWLLRRLQTRRNTEITQAVEVIKDTCRDMITRKKTEQETKTLESTDILSTALKSGVFSDEELVNQMMTFLAAGHETTSSALQWAIYQLCKRPDVHKRLREELQSAVKAGILPSVRELGSEICAEDIESLPYLSATCQEVLRTWAPVPMTMRVSAKESSILGYRVPKGTMVILAPSAINTSESLWGEDAAVFNPDRWISDGKMTNAGGAASAQAFLTFLSGPRSCIGQAFAKAEFSVLLAAWVLAFEISLENDEREVEIQGGITIRPKGGLRCRIHKNSDE